MNGKILNFSQANWGFHLGIFFLKKTGIFHWENWNFTEKSWEN